MMHLLNDVFVNVFLLNCYLFFFDFQIKSFNEILNRFMFIITQNFDVNFYNMHFFAISFNQKIMFFRDNDRNDHRNIDY